LPSGRESGNLSIFQKHDKNNNFEWYTPERYVRKMIPHLDKNQKYVACFDGDESQIYKVLKSEGFDIINNVIDGVYVPYEDLPDSHFEGRHIITNPPFIGPKRYVMKMASRVDVAYIIVPSISYYNMVKYKTIKWVKDFNISMLVDIQRFVMPDGTEKSTHCNWLKFERK